MEDIMFSRHSGDLSVACPLPRESRAQLVSKTRLIINCLGSHAPRGF
ncbi:hypothetical protein ACFPRL_36195 [Pseudoclavibacter helvolus]